MAVPRLFSALESLPAGPLRFAVSYPGGICPERARLLARIARAASAQCESAAKAFIVAGTDNPAEFTRLQDRVRVQLAESQTAWTEYYRHIEEHGC